MDGRSEEKSTKRRYKRAAAEQQLAGVIERCAELAAKPCRFYFRPQALILFGSMLKEDGSDVGDIDLALEGHYMRAESRELAKEAEAWADANAPRNWRYRRHEAQHLQYCSVAAVRYLRGRGIMSRIICGMFTQILCGNSIPYKIVRATSHRIETPPTRREPVSSRRVDLVAITHS